MDRREFLSLSLTGAVGMTAGCMGEMIEGATTFSAVPAIVEEDALEAAGYAERGTDWEVEQREFHNQTVEVRNHLSEYRRTIDLPVADALEAGIFAVIASPEVGVAGEDVNPLEEAEDEEIAERVQQGYDELTIGDEVESRTVDSLMTVEVTTYEGEATLLEAGEAGDLELSVFVDVGSFKHEDDHLVMIGIYPDESGITITDERGRVTTLIEGLRRDIPDEEE